MAQKHAPQNDQQARGDAESQKVPTEPTKTKGVDEDVDAILDEIDGVLEENALEFVRSYIQKGGQ